MSTHDETSTPNKTNGRTAKDALTESAESPNLEKGVISRRKMLGAAALASLGAGAVLAGCTRSEEKEAPPAEAQAPAVRTGAQAAEWEMVTTWPPNFTVLGEAANRLAANVKRMSGGRFVIKVYGGGEKVPPLGVFDAVSGGTVEMGHSASYYWAGKSAAAQFFAAVPFGMNAQQVNGWLYGDVGLQLWRELYEPFGLVPMPGGNTGVQMGGWFNKEIRTVADLQGLKMRIPGLGGKVLGELGVTPILIAGAEIFQALERGTIDAAEWVGPYNDLKLGLHQAAPYYYYPGWHEPGTVLEVTVSKPKWDALSDDLRAMIEMAAAEANLWALSEFEAKNASSLKTLVDQHGVQLKQFPDAVLRQIRSVSERVVNRVADTDAQTRRIYDAFSSFKKANDGYQAVSEWAYQKAQTI